MMSNTDRHSASFRDPTGYVFTQDGKVLRKILPPYFKTYQAIKSSGFYDKLFKHNLLVPHTEKQSSDQEIILEPQQLPFITYPYEWSFEQYKQAALHTLKLEKYALKNGYCLKDATAFNITYSGSLPIFIDTLSLDEYVDGSPWDAYKQFIEHFFGPLLLAKYHGAGMLRLLQLHRDGVPVETISSMLPFKSRFKLNILTNIHTLARFQKKYSGREEAQAATEKKISLSSRMKIVDSLYQAISKLSITESTEWGDYYADDLNYQGKSLSGKEQLINNWCGEHSLTRILDIGGNDGRFARNIPGDNQVIVADIDNAAIDQGFHIGYKEKLKHVHFHVSDILQPSPGLGFNLKERDGIIQRWVDFKLDVTLALALVHHLSLSGNVPFDMQAAFFARFSPVLIIEFPDRTDSWVEFLLSRKRTKKELFSWYNLSDFEQAFSQYFTIEKQEKIADSSRTLYLMRRK